MKSILTLLLVLVGLISQSFAQKNSYGISIGLANGVILKKSLDGDASYDLNRGLSLGFQYSRKLRDKIHLQTGLIWLNSSVSVTPTYYPDIDMTPSEYNVELLYVPIFLKVDVAKHLYINSGIIADFDITKNKYLTSQSGIGIGLGLGTELFLTNKFSIQLNPHLNFHGLILTDREEYPERILDAGAKLIFIIR
jgi:hypothetical protein